MPHYRLSFIGFGNVARSLARLLARKSDLLEQIYGITCSVTGIATGRHGFAINPQGLDIANALELVESGQSISSLSTFKVKDSFLTPSMFVIAN
jgi:homoserine dehydrogenase